jgi:hypothetical protein
MVARAMVSEMLCVRKHCDAVARQMKSKFEQFTQAPQISTCTAHTGPSSIAAVYVYIQPPVRFVTTAPVRTAWALRPSLLT